MKVPMFTCTILSSFNKVSCTYIVKSILNNSNFNETLKNVILQIENDFDEQNQLKIFHVNPDNLTIINK